MAFAAAVVVYEDHMFRAGSGLCIMRFAQRSVLPPHLLFFSKGGVLMRGCYNWLRVIKRMARCAAACLLSRYSCYFEVLEIGDNIIIREKCIIRSVEGCG